MSDPGTEDEAISCYRLHILDERGDLVGAVEFECANDVMAKRKAQKVLDGTPGELWRLIPGGLDKVEAGAHR